MKTSQELFATFKQMHLMTLVEGKVLRVSDECLETQTRLSRRIHRWEKQMSRIIQQHLHQPCAVVQSIIQKRYVTEVVYSIVIETMTGNVGRVHFTVEVDGVFQPVWSYYTQNLGFGLFSSSEQKELLEKERCVLHQVKDCLSEHPSYRLYMLTKQVEIKDMNLSRSTN